jgi:hypothetical protein
MRVKWRRPGELGIEVVDGELSEHPNKLARARRLKRLERENKELRLRLALSDLD